MDTDLLIEDINIDDPVTQGPQLIMDSLPEIREDLSRFSEIRNDALDAEPTRLSMEPREFFREYQNQPYDERIASATEEIRNRIRQRLRDPAFLTPVPPMPGAPDTMYYGSRDAYTTSATYTTDYTISSGLTYEQAYGFTSKPRASKAPAMGRTNTSILQAALKNAGIPITKDGGIQSFPVKGLRAIYLCPVDHRNSFGALQLVAHEDEVTDLLPWFIAWATARWSKDQAALIESPIELTAFLTDSDAPESVPIPMKSLSFWTDKAQRAVRTEDTRDRTAETEEFLRNSVALSIYARETNEQVQSNT